MAQNWAIGNRVNVGFHKSLLITGQETLEERDDKSQPRAWFLEKDNGKRYAFTPHNGLWAL